MYCVLYIMTYALCSMDCVVYIVNCGVCAIYIVLFIVHTISCIVAHSLYCELYILSKTRRHTIRNMSCTIGYIVYTQYKMRTAYLHNANIQHTKYTMHNAPYTMCNAQLTGINNRNGCIYSPPLTRTHDMYNYAMTCVRGCG